MKSKSHKKVTCCKVVCSILVVALIVCLGILAVLIANAITSGYQKYSWDNVEPLEEDGKWILDRERSYLRATRLAKALTIKTISWSEDHQEYDQFPILHHHLQSSFPLFHSSPLVEMTVISNYSLLYKIKGSLNEPKLPYMLTAHLDVVPVNGTWVVDPFEGAIVDGVIYGRGALDDKSSAMGILEAIEFLLEGGYEFQRTFYVAFGHDEEISGYSGAGQICEYLKNNGAPQLDFILDEGYFVLDGAVPGVDGLAGIIGVTEKGSATLELTVEGKPGHSSMPPKESAIGLMARAISRIEENPQPSFFGQGPEWDFFNYIAPSADFGTRLVFSNLWFFSPLLQSVLAGDPMTDAIQRTTTAVTIFQAGYKSNVIPGNASAIVNHRIHPSDKLDRVIEHIRSVVADDRIQISVKEFEPPTNISPYGPDEPAFNLIASTIKQIYPTSMIAPSCSPANTDLRRYQILTTNLYRIAPTIVTPTTLGTVHGDDERISVEDYHNLIQFYAQLILNADLPEAT